MAAVPAMTAHPMAAMHAHPMAAMAPHVSKVRQPHSCNFKSLLPEQDSLGRLNRCIAGSRRLRSHHRGRRWLRLNSWDAAPGSKPQEQSSSKGSPGSTADTLQRHDTVTCLLVLVNVGVFLYERLPLRWGYGGHPLLTWRLQHNAGFRWWQLVTSMFCHANFAHLSSNLFGLYVFGKAVEAESGSWGVLMGYLLTGGLANVVSWLWIRGPIASLGASGAVFGLFFLAALVTLALDWRSLVECFVLGQYAVSQLRNEVFGPSRPGVNHAAHIAGAGAAFVVYFLVRRRRFLEKKA